MGRVELLRTLREESDPAKLTFAAEAAKDEPGDDVVKELIRLAYHKSPVVREGAVYGLRGHLAAIGVLEALVACAREDMEDSPGVRAAARDILEEVRSG